MRDHEKEVYDALFLYFNKILTESGHLNTTLEMGKIQSDGTCNRWRFECFGDNSSVGFVFCHKDTEVHAEPYYEYAEGIAYAIYKDGELIVDGTLPLVVTGNSITDIDAYIGIVDDLIELHNL